MPPCLKGCLHRLNRDLKGLTIDLGVASNKDSRRTAPRFEVGRMHLAPEDSPVLAAPLAGKKVSEELSHLGVPGQYEWANRAYAARQHRRAIFPS